MHCPPLIPSHPYAAFLDRVEKPARYSGGEVGSVVKNWADVQATFCLAFPDIYDIGMSHLGFKILYKILNDDPRTLAERCYTPWVDLEAELRTRKLPLVALESGRPLSDFDVVGFSLQFELSYTNVLTMLELGGIPLRSADRSESDPLVVAGGPTATHPEPLAPFIDAFVIGDGEEMATKVALTWANLKREGVPRRERLVALARLGTVYVPSLYGRTVDPGTGLFVVDAPTVPGLPFPIERSLVDINAYPFPDRGPTGGPEAIFDRLSIEIARGCTEGCRFCQAGMIYRPVRERDPEQVVSTVLSAVKSSGQDEVSLTALSTADVSCIAPLITTIASRLAEERVSLGVSSLRAYGLSPDLLDQIRRVRATGLTFAPEAGTQRMRDVVNKNVTEEQLMETAERVFSRGWGKLKLYFMIGLPTETDDDVRGIVETGARTATIGRKAARGRAAEVTVSVSTHVPKPHTPFQWAAMDSAAEVERKQQLLRDTVRGHRAVKLKTHGVQASVLEGIFARGDIQLADVLERAYKNGARFDSWDDRIRLDIWEEAFTHFGIDRGKYLGTFPVDTRLPWSHIDVGLANGFLAREYRKALKDRLSPPCGKAVGTFVHHTNADDARSDQRRLVCYDCGVACDLTAMRSERIAFLEKLGAHKRPLPVVAEPVATGPQAAPNPVAPEELPVDTAVALAEPAPKQPVPQGRGGHRVRLRYQKTGAMALLGHLDVIREIPRVMRRVGITMVFTKGFHPKPDMTFGPALSLGVMTIDDYADVRLAEDIDGEGLERLTKAMTQAGPMGFAFTGARKLEDEDLSIARIVSGARYVLVFARGTLEEALGGPAEQMLKARVDETLAQTSIPFRRDIDGLGKMLDLRPYLKNASVGGEAAREIIAKAGLVGDLVSVDIDCAITVKGAAKASEIAATLAGPTIPHRAIRAELYGMDERGRFSPLEPGRGRREKAPIKSRSHSSTELGEVAEVAIPPQTEQESPAEGEDLHSLS